MVSGSEVRVACPSVYFFFAHLGAALGVSGDFLPLVGDFIFAGCGLSVVLGELSPILCQSIAWFEGETKRMSEVRSNELGIGLSSSGDPEEVIQSSLLLVWLGLFMPSRRCVGWMLTLWVDSRIGFNFQNGFAFMSPIMRIRLAISYLVRYAFTRLPSLVGSGSLSIHL